jgi:hypothetical protein
MKKIIALFIITLGLGFTASAQQKVKVQSATTAMPTTPTKASESAATTDVATLNKVVPLTDAEKKTYFGLFEYKHRTLSATTTTEGKNTLAQSIDAKLRAGLNPAQMAKLDGNKKVLYTLTH